MNHAFALDMAQALADRLKHEEGTDPDAQVRRGFALAFGRSPTTAEQSESVTLIARHGLTAFCRVILNANELIYLD